jgi:hypothetical protein
MNAQTEIRPSLPALVVGGNVNAIVPQSIEEMWRVSKMVVLGGLAPKALVGKKNGDEAISAVAIAVMAGAELGLPPMVALRSFTVIGGRPALYGDGLINVVRRSKKAAYVRTGYDEARGVGWCEAKRSDTGEEKREEFSVADAKRAGLWDERATVKKQDWNTKAWTEVPNDAPWFRYPRRMQMWRAAGYCLRELFADVLGGITDEYEAREIAGEDEMRDITPKGPPSPPSPPSPSQPIDEAEPFDATQYFHDFEDALAVAGDEATVEEVWSAHDPEGRFDGDDTNLNIANVIKSRRLKQIAELHQHPMMSG